ncbi:MAG TPA: decarboxylating 6-phosphogluconate dehydrogenase, partial [Thermoanaerobaculia bacterium]|nr:decarboxylating 6-phosphogluconate dehydrogenase [Thermoanaerobaculia bacterium]
KLGMIGLGRMGANMTKRLTQGGHAVVAWSRGNAEAAARDAGAEWAPSAEALLRALPKPAIVWLMIPAGAPVDETLSALRPGLASGDVVIDGGNSFFRDSMRRAAELAPAGIAFIDAGTSGGVWGLENGYCLMVGGDAAAVERVRPIFETLAPENGFARVGASGAGHYVKMVHNGIEYAMLQGLGEGFEILNASEFSLDLPQIAGIWRYGSVVRSWLLDLLADALGKDPKLERIKGWVEDSGEGRWTLKEAIDHAVPAPALADALFARFRSRQADSFAARAIAALRNEFGGHAVKKS